MGHDIHLVTLGLGREIFAVPVGCVIEILAMRDLFVVPDAPPYLAGLTHVRSQAVPVVDLRRKLGLSPSQATHQTRIIVLEVPTPARTLVVGLIADRVIEVISLRQSEIGPPPDIGTAWGSGYIAGIGRHCDDFVIVFDMARLFSGEEVAHIAADTVTTPRAAPVEAA
jgi:purine-binding chemotaxis protein CheW